ncbi:hypothetical protein KSS87_002369 [Heliosperma pusillum]|nr:hypothetical protein KSS87_002369 [Heliosperma pusillum]
MMTLEEKVFDLVPSLVMFIMEGCTIALTITAKSAMNAGMNQFVFVAYTNALSSILLLSYCLIFHRERVTIAQNLAFTGLRESSPIVVSTFAKFPDMMVIVTCYTIFGTVQTVFVDVVANGDINAWKLKWDLELLIIVLTALFGTLVRSRVQAWCMGLKGPMYVAEFKPLGLFWACLIGLSLFGSSLHFGSVIGTGIVAMGYLTVLSGVKEETKLPVQDNPTKPRPTTYNNLKSPFLPKDSVELV